MPLNFDFIFKIINHSKTKTKKKSKFKLVTKQNHKIICVINNFMLVKVKTIYKVMK